ncbi:MAG: hypothetical protein H7222_07315 [Methylotenera sp.]|nr:hypothetical protein [Oligoflexia bacterium]
MSPKTKKAAAPAKKEKTFAGKEVKEAKSGKAGKELKTSRSKDDADDADDHTESSENSEPQVDMEELEEAEEEAKANSGGGGNAAALAAATGGSEMSASFKNFRHHPDMENFYRFIFENDLRHEALAIIDTMMEDKLLKKQGKDVKGAKGAH